MPPGSSPAGTAASGRERVRGARPPCEDVDGGWDRAEEAKPPGVGETRLVFPLVGGDSGSGQSAEALCEARRFSHMDSQIQRYLSPCLSGL